MHVRHLTRHRLPQLRRGRAAARRPGVTTLVGPERPGQDQPRRGDRLPRDAVQPPGRRPTSRWSGSGRSRRSIRGVGRARRPRDAASSSSSTRAGPTGPGSTARRCRGRARCSARCARCCSRPRTWPWSRATRPSGAASSTTCSSQRQPRWAGVRVRLRQGPQAAQRPAEVGRAGAAPRPPSPERSPPRRRAGGRRPRLGPAHARRVGRPPRHGRVAAALRPAAPAARPRPVPRRGLRRRSAPGSPTPGSSYRLSLREAAAAPAGRRRGPRRRRAARPSCSPRSRRSRDQEVERGISPGRSAPRRPAS